MQDQKMCFEKIINPNMTTFAKDVVQCGDKNTTESKIVLEALERLVSPQHETV
jgi:hypothetical protein